MPATNKTQIMNLALSAIGQRMISSPDEESKNARQCVLVYDKMRREVLHSCWWTWAGITKQLTLIDWQNGADPGENTPTVPVNAGTGDDVPPNFIYLYLYPNDSVMVRKLLNRQRAGVFTDPFRMFGRSNPGTSRENMFEIQRARTQNIKGIATNVGCAWASYTIDLVDPTQFDDLFVDALAYRIAAEINMPLTGDKEMQGIVERKLFAIMSEAKRINRTEGTESAPRSSAYEDARESS